MLRADTVIRQAWEKHLDTATRAYESFVIDADTRKLPSRTRARLFPRLFNIRGAGQKLRKGGLLTDEQAELAAAAIEENRLFLAATPPVHLVLIDLYEAIRKSGDGFLGKDPESQLLAIAFDHVRSGGTADRGPLAALLDARRANDRSLNSADLDRAISKSRSALDTRLSQRWAGDPAVNRPPVRSAPIAAIVQRIVDEFAIDRDDQPIIADSAAATAAWNELLSSPDVARYRSSRAMMLASNDLVPRPPLDGPSVGERPLEQTIKRRITRLFQGDHAPVETDALLALERAVDGSAEAYGLKTPESQAAIVVTLDVARRILMGDAKRFGNLWDGSFRVEWVRARAKADSAFWAAHNLLMDPTEEILRRVWNRVFRAEIAGSPLSSPLSVWSEAKGTIVSVREDLVSEVGDVDVIDGDERSEGGANTGQRRGGPGSGEMAKIVEVIIDAGFGDDDPDGQAFLREIGARHVITDSASPAQFDEDRKEWERCVAAAVAQRRFTIDASPTFSQLLTYMRRVLDGD